MVYKQGKRYIELMIAKRKKVFEDQEKIYYEGPEAGTFVYYFKDTVPFLEGEISGKGVLNNHISSYFYKMLHSMGVETHFLKRQNMREQLVAYTEEMPFKCIIRNQAAGSFVNRFNMVRGEPLMQPVLEFFTEEVGGPKTYLSFEHMRLFEWIPYNEYKKLCQYLERVNAILQGGFYSLGYSLVDITLDIGRSFDEFKEQFVFIICSAITPDNCRLHHLKNDAYYLCEQDSDIDYQTVYKDLATKTEAIGD